MLRTNLKVLIWAYLFFLIFEGVFRKWLLPGQSNLFLVVRDPIVVLIYALAILDRRFPWNWGTLGTAGLGLIAMVFSFFGEMTEVVVLLYGFKAAFLHLPLIWVLPEVFERKDLVWVERAVFALAPVMAVLMAIQFRADPESIWNVAPGGTLDGQMEGAMGRIRPPGLFSFITGAAQFCGLLSAFLLGAALRPQSKRMWWVLGGVTVCLLLCMSVSISRMLVIMTVAPLFMLGFLIQARPELVIRMVALIGLGAVAMAVASGLEVFDEGAEAFQSRLGRTGEYHSSWYERASNVVVRMFEDPRWALAVAQDAPLLGHGLGAGTNVAAATRSGKLQFTMGEGEWMRMISELGPLLGFPYLLFRTAVGLSLLFPAWAAARTGAGLPVFLLGNAFPLIWVGQWGQATTLGFSVVLGGLVLATARAATQEAEETAAPEEIAEVPEPPPRIRSRAVPAELPPLRPRTPRPELRPLLRFAPPAPRMPEPEPEMEPAAPARFHVRPRPRSTREGRS